MPDSVPRLWLSCGFAILIWYIGPAWADQLLTVEDSPAYFPDDVGNYWSYRGEVTEGPVQSIEHKIFVNESKVLRTEKRKGVELTVFHDSNAGNHGPSDSYYRRDAVGIVYHGSEPGTPLERQLVPYQIVQFPLRYPSSFQQFDRNQLDFGNDLDGDGVNERVDVQGVASVVGRDSVTVPAGKFPDTVHLEARMMLRITLSANKHAVTGTDVMNAWFAKGVGMVKYVERQELPPLRRDRGLVSEIQEELVDYQVKGPLQSFDRRESPPQGIFAHDTRGHELQ
ncbi:MAG: hypothetical protein AB7G48_09290 [Nitrospiraceae bacterium]